jgi:glutathione S-transferase
MPRDAAAPHYDAGMHATLVIANKNYSSWSMRPWVLMHQLGIPFDEHKLSFNLGLGAGFGDAVRRFSPAARVPVLRLALDGGELVVHDSLAIIEAVNDFWPGHGVWPADRADRALARALAAEMHAGFGTLRSLCPMNIEADLRHLGPGLLAENPRLHTDLARVDAIFAAARGPFLFGPFCAADAFYAPVALRLRGYGLPVSAPAQAYAERLLGAPGPAAWIADALDEHEWVAEDEPYRTPPAGA